MFCLVQNYSRLADIASGLKLLDFRILSRFDHDAHGIELHTEASAYLYMTLECLRRIAGVHFSLSRSGV